VRLIQKNNKRGSIEIEYYSLEELDRLLEYNPMNNILITGMPGVGKTA